jgi:hypothetical protein
MVEEGLSTGVTFAQRFEGGAVSIVIFVGQTFQEGGTACTKALGPEHTCWVSEWAVAVRLGLPTFLPKTCFLEADSSPNFSGSENT